jgi:hypothetical protein
MLLSVLETLLETQPGLERLVQEAGQPGGQDLAPDNSRDGGEKGTEEREEEALMLDTLLQRVQATLLAIYKLQAARTPKKAKEGVEGSAPGLLVKMLYADSLKIGDKSASGILRLLQDISKQLSTISA